MKLPSFPLYANDFYVDTITWDLDELGLYTRLLFIEWSNGPLPADPKKLSKIAGISVKKFSNLFQICVEKFIKTDDGHLINVRLEEERVKILKYSKSRQEIANRRWSKDDAYASQPPMHMDMHTGCLSSSSSNKDNILVPQTTPRDPEPGPPRADKKPNCPHQKIIDLYHGLLPVLPRVREWTPARQKLLAARWNENKDRQHTEWWSDLFGYIADKCPHLVGRNDRRWTADLEWIIKQGNLIKIIEGKYER